MSAPRLRDAALTFFIRVASAVLTLALQVLLARLMDLGTYGNYVTLWTWLIALGSFGALGFAESSVRFLPRYQARASGGRIHRFWRFGFRATVLGSGALALIALAIAVVAGPSTTPGLIALFIALGLPFLAIEYYLEGIARSFGWYRLSTLPVYILRPILIGAVLVALWAAGVTLTLAVVGAVIVVAMAAISIGLAIAISRRIGPAPVATRRALAGPERLWLRASLPLLLATALEDLILYYDVVIVSMVLAPDNVAIYFAAARTLALANFVHFALYFVAGRGFALALEGNRTELEGRVLEAARLTFWLTLVSVGIAVAAGPLVLAAFGPAFTEGYAVMLVLAAGYVARSVAGQAAEALVVTGRLRESILVGGAVFAAYVTLAVVLAPAFGIVGAAAAAALALTLRAILLVVTVRRSLGIRSVSLALPSFRQAAA